jgi:hypothetical protein
LFGHFNRKGLVPEVVLGDRFRDIGQFGRQDRAALVIAAKAGNDAGEVGKQDVRRIVRIRNNAGANSSSLTRPPSLLLICRNVKNGRLLTQALPYLCCLVHHGRILWKNFDDFAKPVN